MVDRIRIKTWAEKEYKYKITDNSYWELGPPNYGIKRTLEVLLKILEAEE